MMKCPDLTDPLKPGFHSGGGGGGSHSHDEDEKLKLLVPAILVISKNDQQVSYSYRGEEGGCRLQARAPRV